MRLLSMLLVMTAPMLLVSRADACPETVSTDISTAESPSTSSPCLNRVDFSTMRRAIELRYVVGAGGTSQTGVGTAASAFAALELGYALQFGSDDAQPSYEAELTAGLAVQRVGGDVSATGLVTRAGARLGPARVNQAVVDNGRNNFAAFPLTMELAHVGQLAATPRLAARPELARAQYGRERVAVATRLLRVEGAGDKPSTTAPGATPAKKPTSWAFDFIPLHSELDVAMQSTTRFETTLGGSLLGVTDHTSGARLDVFGIEHRWINLPMAPAMSLDTLWVLRLDGVNPHTGTQYSMGWGVVIAMPDRDELARRIDPEGGDLTIGGAGWFAERAWGGFGAQYKREPFVTMTGAVALEDRISAEVYVPRALGLIARTFAARTTRLVDDELQHEMTAGVELDATYAREGWSSNVGLQLGRTFYTALDDAVPQTTGFAACLGLTLQHTGRRAWVR